jgi:hypothetical protein
MSSPSRGNDSTALHIVKLAAIASSVLVACNLTSSAEEKTIPPCREDAMVVFDASGSMSGNETLGIPNSRARIDEARSALARVLPNATKFRRIGLVTYGPGPWNQCNVKLEFKPTANAAFPIMSTVNAIVPAGKTPLTQGIEEAAEALDFRTSRASSSSSPTVKRRAGDLLASSASGSAPRAISLPSTPLPLDTRATLGQGEATSWTLCAWPNRLAASMSKPTARKSLWRRWRRHWTARWSPKHHFHSVLSHRMQNKPGFSLLWERQAPSRRA